MKKQEFDSYSGPFDPQWKYENLSKKALIRLLNEFGRAYIAIDGFWFTLVENKFGLDTAMELDTAIWAKYIPPWTTPRFRKALDIPGNSVETLFFIHATDKTRNDELFCFNEKGTILWKHKIGKEERIGSRVYSDADRIF